MTQPAARPPILRFDSYEVDLRAGELRRNGIRVRLQDKSFQLLGALLERPGEVVTQEDLEARLWPDVEVDVSGSLGEHVHRLRRALDDSARHPRYIETAQKRGYRFIGTLAPVSPDPPQPEPVVSSFRNWLLTAAIALGSVALGAAGYSHFRAPELVEPLPRRFSFPVEKLTVNALTQPIVAISPDGKRIVFGADRALWLQELDQLWNPHKLAGTETLGLVEPAWSPDSSKLAFVNDGEIFSLDLSSGAPTRLAKVPAPGYPRVFWSPDGRSILLQCQTKSGAWSLDTWEAPLGGGPIKPSEAYSGTPPKASLFRAAGRVRALGEGGFFFRTTLVVWDAPGREPRKLSTGCLPQYDPATGNVVFQRRDGGVGIWAMPFSADQAEPLGRPFVVAQGGKSPSVSMDGTLVYAVIPEEYDRLLLLNRSGNPIRHIGERQYSMDSPSFSPDGKRVAVRGFEESTETDWMVDIWTHEVDRPTKNRLTIHPGVDLYPRWVDARTVSFSSDRSRVRGLYARAINSSRPAELLWGDGSGWISDWSSDGRRAVLKPNRTEPTQNLWLFDVQRRKVEQLLATPHNLRVAVFSPDDRYLAFVSDRSGSREIWVCPIDNCAEELHRVSTKGGDQVRWTKEEGAIYYVEGNRRMMQVKITTEPGLVIGEPKVLFDSPYLWLPGSNREWFYDVTDDGERFVVVDPARARTTKESPGVIHVWQNWAAAFAEGDR